MSIVGSVNSTVRGSRPILSIRARLVIVALLAVAPLMFDRVRLLEASRSERIATASAEVLDLAKRGAEGQREIITTVRAMLQVMARAYVAMLARGESCNFYLTDIAANMPWINGMSIVGADGRIMCSTLPNAIGLDLSDRAHYRTAQETRDFVISDYIVGRINGRPAIIAVYPTHAIDPNVNAAIVASVDLRWVSNVISSLDHRPGSTVLLIDRNGTVLAGDPRVAKLIDTNVGDAPLMKEMSGRDEGTTWAVGLDGVRRMYGFVRVPATGGRLVIGLDESDVLRRIDNEIMISYLQLSFFMALVMLIAWFGGERLIVDPIRTLARTATRFGHGDLDVHPARDNWVKEFAPLAAALNDMARKLAEREKELRDANHHLAELASLDALSGLANRRGFDARLAAEWQRAGKLRRPVGLLMVDVDCFKLFNDRYGHVEGDVCLRRVGKLLMDAADDEDDLPARYGGEEFVLLLPGAGVDRTLAVAERLRRAVESLCIAHASAPSGQVTVSIGVASLIPDIGEDAARLVEAADVGLYAAKRRGRNTVVAHGAVTLAAAS